jgi:GNAT superfamily N-acetyltransferase
MRVDRELVARLERSAAAMEVATVESMRRLDPRSPADARPLRAGAMIATGPGRYVNRVIGLTLEPLLDDDVAEIQTFYDSRGLAPAVELSSWADSGTVALLAARGFAPSGFRAVMARPLGVGGAPLPGEDDRWRINVVDDASIDRWLGVLASAFGVTAVDSRAISDEFARAKHAISGSHDLVASFDGRPVACGSLLVDGEVAWLGGAGTVSEARRLGAQTRLIGERIRLAARLGCSLVAATAVPGGSSERNLLRLGFHHVQTIVDVSAWLAHAARRQLATLDPEPVRPPSSPPTRPTSGTFSSGSTHRSSARPTREAANHGCVGVQLVPYDLRSSPAGQRYEVAQGGAERYSTVAAHTTTCSSDTMTAEVRDVHDVRDEGVLERPGVDPGRGARSVDGRPGRRRRPG